MPIDPKTGRRHPRRPIHCKVTLTWDAGDQKKSVQSGGINVSEGGLRVAAPVPIPIGTTVFIQAPELDLMGNAEVRYCQREDAVFMIGMQFSESTARTLRLPNTPLIDYYEILQISPRAENETIHRVFRIMASRFHPDNQVTGNRELFRRITQAYEVLSNPQKRAEYDAVYRLRSSEPMGIFEMHDFVDDLDGEKNRRLGTLCLLYNKRRNCPDHPSLSLLDLERRMSLPREYLMFTTWFLKEEGLLKTDDTSSYFITSTGIKYVESQIQASPLVQNLLAPGHSATEDAGGHSGTTSARAMGPAMRGHAA